LNPRDSRIPSLITRTPKSEEPISQAHAFQYPATPTKQSLLAAKELAAQVKSFADGDDIEEHYQAILLSLDEPTRTEFNAWIKSEDLREEIRGKPEALKKRLLEKFRVRKSLLERIKFITQPRRREHRLVVDLLERERVYGEVYEEMKKNREKLLVEAALQLLTPEDRADYGNLFPNEATREMKELIEFARRKEEERLRYAKYEPQKKNENKEETKKKKTLTEEEARIARLKGAGRCFICEAFGHMAADCPDKLKNKSKSTTTTKSSKKRERRGSSEQAF